jgi:hypothetical protein
MATVNPKHVIDAYPKLGSLQIRAPGDWSSLSGRYHSLTPQTIRAKAKPM